MLRLLFVAASAAGLCAQSIVVPNASAFGLGRLSIPMQNGCELLMVPVATQFVLLDHNGRSEVQITAPPGLQVQFNAQLFVLDSANQAGFTLSNGVEPQTF